MDKFIKARLFAKLTATEPSRNPDKREVRTETEGSGDDLLDAYVCLTIALAKEAGITPKMLCSLASYCASLKADLLSKEGDEDA